MRQPSAPSRRFSFFGLASAPPGAVSRRVNLDPPRLKLESDREVYRPGDPITITIEIRNPTDHCSLLIEKLSFECKGIEKLDSQWFNTPKPTPDPKQQCRGEYVFMDCSNSTIVSNQIISSGTTKTYLARVLLPDTIPPSYRGTTIRYLYYCKTTLSGQFLILENGLSRGESILDFPQLEVRLPLQIWVTQKNNGRLGEEGCIDGIVPLSTILLDIYWKEMDADSEWAKVNEAFDGIEEGYESSRDEILSVSSYNQMKEYINKGFGSSLSLQSLPARSSTRGSLYVEGRPSISPSMALPRLSVAEVLHDSTAVLLLFVGSPSQAPKHPNGLFAEDDSRTSSGSGSTESGLSEGIVRGRSYNIRLDDQVLLKFSPKNSESTYYFSDLIGGTLTFLHEEGTRRCLELTITLEAKETINRRFVHPSRRHAPTITKIHSDHHEVVADLVQTSFLFSIPVDGPMTFSTSYISVQWALRFEFLTTPQNVDWTRFEHPLLIEGRDKCEWVLPITVHAPPLVAAAAQTRNEKLLFSGPMWIRT
ncbi:rab6a-gef complex partner protein 2 [Phtheirospermum japonicum]|uniref:Rab6a-gef complex partner protein 2 n=1 Tax=Phtheirospermum japonicum TaxID=374723 RepID=A0A830B8E3_9LAMI|nr:rab6a-gef complex partner protein 2 [Phtheirospermum japonicum]